MTREWLPDPDIDEAVRLLLQRGHKEAALLLGEVDTVEVVPAGDGGDALELTFDEVTAHELSRREQHRITEALTEVLASKGRRVTGTAVRAMASGLEGFVGADDRTAGQRFVDRFRADGGDQRFLCLLGAVAAVAWPFLRLRSYGLSWQWGAVLAGGLTCGFLLFRFWRWLDPRRPFTRGHATCVLELREGPQSNWATCSCGWLGESGNSLEAAFADAREHSTAEPVVVGPDEAARNLSREHGDGPAPQPG